MDHCLKVGGEHFELKHFRLTTAYTAICRTSAHFMLLNSQYHSI
jgi:hypothetical protein